MKMARKKWRKTTDFPVGNTSAAIIDDSRFVWGFLI